jgi:hypothetical protein
MENSVRSRSLRLERSTWTACDDREDFIDTRMAMSG